MRLQCSLRWAKTLATELRRARKYLGVLVWLLSQAPGRTWAKLSYNWLVQAETAMLQVAKASKWLNHVVTAFDRGYDCVTA